MAEWNGMEPRFLLYVRHDHLDNIMEHLSELPAYCLEDDRAELLSTLDAAPAHDGASQGIHHPQLPHAVVAFPGAVTGGTGKRRR